MTKLSQDMNEDFAQFRDRAQGLEKRRHQNWTPDPKFNRPQPHPCQEPRRTLYRDPEHNPRSLYPYLVDSEKGPVRNTEPYAPTFDGRQETYIKLEEQMDQYFECTNILKLGQIRLAKTKFTKHARSHWYAIEHECYQRKEEIYTWRDMRSKLRDRYLGRSYEKRLLDQWYQLRQDNRPVSKYIEDFQWYDMKCNTIETEAQITSRFRVGLHPDIYRKLCLEKTNKLDRAYQEAQDYEWSLRYNQSSTLDLKQTSTNLSQVPIDPTPVVNQTFVCQFPLVSPLDQKDNTEKELGMAIPKLVDLTRAVPKEESKENRLEPFSEIEEEIYEPDISLIDEYEEEEFEDISPDNLINQLLPDGVIERTPATQGIQELTLREDPFEEVQEEEIAPNESLSENTSEFIEESKEDTPESNLVEKCEEGRGSQELPIEKVQEQEKDSSLEDFLDKHSKDLPNNLPPSRSTQPTLELALVDPPRANHEVWMSTPIE